jgi:hypothetical protein
VKEVSPVHKIPHYQLSSACVWYKETQQSIVKHQRKDIVLSTFQQLVNRSRERSISYQKFVTINGKEKLPDLYMGQNTEIGRIQPGASAGNEDKNLGKCGHLRLS